MQIIKCLDAGQTQSDPAKEFNIERTTVTRLKRKKNEIICNTESYKGLNQNRQCKTEGALVEKSSMIWFNQGLKKSLKVVHFYLKKNNQLLFEYMNKIQL